MEALGQDLSSQPASVVSQMVSPEQGQTLAMPRRAFVPTAAQLKALPLQPGQNTIDFTFAGQRLRAYMYVLDWNARCG